MAIRLHGDGVPITGLGKAWQKMMDVFSWRLAMCKMRSKPIQVSKFQENLPGGFSKSKADGSSSFSAAKGVMDGQAYIGFVVPADGFGAELSTFGWVDLTIGENEAGKLTLTINRWAYESVAGTAASIPGGTPVPGAGGLLALALGAAGVRRRRERVA